mmetsp:Transcript_14366/g.27712  ORF Transcript_14366/g.27712 Transcript_14366/m.27712 type:complete len:85 (+) Transcript_14366:424-678(+)
MMTLKRSKNLLKIVKTPLSQISSVTPETVMQVYLIGNNEDAWNGIIELLPVDDLTECTNDEVRVEFEDGGCSCCQAYLQTKEKS